jgi:tetratricopeptide (TPR) repeat protein
MNNITPTAPSLAFGYFRPWEENANALTSYLDYKRDVSLTQYGADTVGKYIASASKQHVAAVEKMAQDIGQGFGVLSRQMSAIDQTLSFVNRNLDMLTEQQRLSNLLLRNIAELLRVPDSEKDRQHSIEQGIKFFVNAQHDPDLYADALEFLEKAEQMMRQDYFVLHRIGCIHLYAENHIDLEKALEKFLRAAKYASVESDPKARRLASVLTQNSDAANSEINSSTEATGLLAADSYDKAAFCAYILGRFADAVNYQTKALRWTPNARCRFALAKYQARNAMTDEAQASLAEAVSSAPLMLAAIFREIDFVSEPWIVDFVARQKVAREVFRVLGKKDAIITTAIQQCVGAWEKLSSASDNFHARIYGKFFDRLGQLLISPCDDKVKASLAILEDGLSYKPSATDGDKAMFFGGQAHRLFSITRQRIEGYEAYVRAAHAGIGFGDNERALVHWIYAAKCVVLEPDCFEIGDSSSGSEDKSLLCLLVDALTLVAALDGRIGSREIDLIRKYSSRYGSDEEMLEQVKRTARRIRDTGPTTVAKDLRDRLLQYRGTQFLEFLLRSQGEVANCDGMLHKNELQVLAWLKKQLEGE